MVLKGIGAGAGAGMGLGMGLRPKSLKLLPELGAPMISKLGPYEFGAYVYHGPQYNSRS